MVGTSRQESVVASSWEHVDSFQYIPHESCSDLSVLCARLAATTEKVISVHLIDQSRPRASSRYHRRSRYSPQ